METVRFKKRITKRIPRKMKMKFEGYVPLDDYGYYPSITVFDRINLDKEYKIIQL